MLKRPDEKFVTEQAYRRPRFVEDVLRDVVLELRADPAVAWFAAECEAEESIHPHNAFASQQERGRRARAAPGSPLAGALRVGLPAGAAGGPAGSVLAGSVLAGASTDG